MVIRIHGIDRRWFLNYSSAVLFVILLLTLFLHAFNSKPSPQESPGYENPSGAKLPAAAKPAEPAANAATVISAAAAANGPTIPAHPNTHEPQLHVVIAHYSEEPFYMRRWIDSLRSIPFVQELGAKVIIYTKSSDTVLAVLKETTAADEVVQLPNVGREGSTYLHHILRVYDDPPKFILFAQAVIKKGLYWGG